MHLRLICLYCLLKFSVGQYEITSITVNVKGGTTPFIHFWESTGFCPPDPKEKIYEFVSNDSEKFNLALIGSLPNNGIKQVRIHWLFNLIFSSNNKYNFTYLDNLFDFLHFFNLKPRFELMGLPTNTENMFQEKNVIQKKTFWKNFVYNITRRYISRYGAQEVSSWRFELWNEPDLHNYNLLNFTLSEYLEYAIGCDLGLRSAFDGKEAPQPLLGGPAGLFREQNHPLCWGLLEFCSGNSSCPIQFISFHRKGDGTAEGVLNGTLELLDLLHNKFPDLINNVPIANDESDIITSWSSSWEWRSDARYASMVVKVISDHYKSLSLSRKLKIELLSNDNGFVNYHPFYFTQRTLFCRFQMNLTQPPHQQFIKKPIYGAMALLSFLEEAYLVPEINSEDSLLTVIATKSTDDVYQSNSAVLVAYSDNDEVNIETIKCVRVDVNNLSIGSRSVVYLLDNRVTNPYSLWQQMGSPVFPDWEQRRRMRKHEGPHRLFAPTEILESKLTVWLNLTIPSVALIHICSKPSTNPGSVTKLSVFNVTRDEVLLTWNDAEIGTKCIKTYEIEFESTCSNSLQFVRVNGQDTIFLSYHHAPTGDGACEATIGRYRVRAMDYWDQKGNYSEIVSFP